jgi:hypothetical protein
MQSRRDAGITALVLGFFASAWFGWGQAAPAAALGIVGQADYIPVWVCAVVGVHLVPLAPLLRDRRLVVLGVLVTMVALAALVAGLTQTATPSTVTGVGAGLLLLGFATAELAAALRR